MTKPIHRRTRAPACAERNVPQIFRLALVAITLGSGGSAAAQLPMRATVIKDATILVGDGSTIESGSIVITGEKITAVGPKARGGMLAKSVPAKGKYVTPGLIDAWCTLSLSPGEQTRTPAARAIDAWDRYDRDLLDAALRSGVTTAYIPARTLSGLGGLGAVVRLIPGGNDEEVIVADEAAISATIGGDWRLPPLQRAKAAAEFRKSWEAAKQYRKSLEDYEADLKEYEEKIKKRAEENKDGKKEEKKDEKKEEKKEDAPKEPPRPTPPSPPRPTPRPDRPPRPGRPRPATPEARDERAAETQGAEKKDDKDAIKKPAEPKKDPGKETQLRAIDGKLVLRVEAHRPEDILNALDVAKQFNLALVLEGATGACLIADRIAAANVPVVLWPGPPAMTFDYGPGRYHEPGLASKLSRAGVRVCIGSGPEPSNSAGARHLALLAATAVGDGFDANQALRAITGDAADLLGVAADLGTIASGKYADLVIWSDHPFSAGAKVEQVFIRGKEVYRAAGGSDEAEKDESESKPAEKDDATGEGNESERPGSADPAAEVKK